MLVPLEGTVVGGCGVEAMVPMRRTNRNSRVPLLAVVTKEPKLGFEIPQVAKRTLMSPCTSSLLLLRSALIVNVTG